MNKVAVSQAVVVDPVTDPATGLVTVSVTMRAGFVPAVAVPPQYTPQRGDTVTVITYGDNTQQHMVINFPPARLTQPVVPTIRQVDSAPGSGYVQGSAFYAPVGQSPVRDFVMVRTAPPTGVGGSKAVAATDSRTWDPSNGWFDTLVRQGSFGTGANYGLWIYPDLPTALSGLTVTGATMHVQRDGAAGTGGPAQLHFYLHGYTAVPTGGGAPTFSSERRDLLNGNPSRGASCDVTIPTDWVTALVAGTARGVGITGNDGLNSGYLACLGPDRDATSGQLTFTYS